MDGRIVLVGAFNQTLDDHLDRSNIKTGLNPRDRTAINTLKEEIGLVDIWRLINPREREYTFYSHSHRTYSLID